jgi:hypothetical protein
MCSLPQPQSEKRRSTLSRLVISYFILSFVLHLDVQGMVDEPYRFQAGLRISENLPLSDAQRRSLLNGLKSCTGFMELHFDESGQLSVGDRTHLTHGSNTARELLFATVESRDSFILESSTHSPTIAFAEIAGTDTYIDALNGEKRGVWRVRLDFSDFANLRGPDHAVASFTPAINLLHELGHGVLKKWDLLTSADQLGDCERHINLIRRELGLPVRETYQPRGWRAVSPGNSTNSFQAEFRFSMIDEHTHKKKTFYLAFDVDRVCDVSKVRSLPPGRAEILAALR